MSHSVVQDNESSLRVWLPLRTYTLKVEHRLLKQLGSISHFLLSALDRHTFNLEQIEALLGLDRIQLEPIIKRLNELQFIKDLTLTNQGKRYAFILAQLHRKEVSFNLDDGCHGSPLRLWLDKHEAIAPIPERALVLGTQGEQPYQWPTWNVKEDCVNQLNRLKQGDRDCTWMRWLFPAFDCLDEGKPLQNGEWELSLRRNEENKDSQFGVPLKIELGELNECKNNPALTLYTPVLSLKTEYLIPQGIPDVMISCLPEPTTIFFDYLNWRIADEVPLTNDIDSDIWPGLEKLDEPMAVQELFLQVQRDCYPEGEVERMLDRCYRFNRHWRQHQIGWDVVWAKCGQFDNTWLAKGKQQHAYS